MSKITQEEPRRIIDDFEKIIDESKDPKGAEPSTACIPFRDDLTLNTTRDVWMIPVQYLRFRKDNHRIISDIKSYEANHGPLEEDKKEAQKIIKEMLENKDPVKTVELIASIKHIKQTDAAVITADGFLVNGNRRKMAFEKLYEKTKDEQYKRMKVVILPGNINKDGPPPTKKDIKRIENRYQTQKDGRSMFTMFDQALGIRDNDNDGFTLEEQLRDDPRYHSLSDKDLKTVMKQWDDDYIKPLEAIDNYLRWVNRPSLYDTVTERWQAFYDYHNSVIKNKLDNENWRLKNNISEDEIGEIEEIAFKIIRKKDIPKFGQLHKIMRDFLKWYINSENSKKYLRKFLDHVDDDLPENKQTDEENNELTDLEKDIIWGENNANEITKNLVEARKSAEWDAAQVKPLTLLEEALKKLNHEELTRETFNIKTKDAKTALSLSSEIGKRANELEHIFYDIDKSPEKLVHKHKKNK